MRDLTDTDTRAAAHQRARGRAEVALVRRGDRHRIGRLYQAGSAKAFLPRTHTDRPEVVFLNTAGGLTGGDAMGFSLTLGDGAMAVGTTQAAERVYASLGAPARMDVALSVGAGGILHWLPQETIVYDRAALARRTRLDLAGDARALICETVILGRAAMGERVTRCDLSDWREVRRDGRPVLVEPLRLTDADLAGHAGDARLGGATAMATIALIGPDAEAKLIAARRCLEVAAQTVTAAASAWDGRLVIRALATDAFELRRLVAEALRTLSERPLPRVWTL